MNFDFTTKTKPTVEQVRFVWNEMARPSGRKVAAELQKRGAKISFKTVMRYKRNDWAPVGSIGTNDRAPLQKKLEKQSTVVNNAIRAEIEKMDPLHKAVAKNGIDGALGGPMTNAELTAMQIEINDLAQKSDPELVALLRRDQLIFSIMVLRFGARRADLMVLVPKDSASLMASSAEVKDSYSTVAPAQLNASDGSMIDVTPNANEVSSAIDDFLRKEGVAA